MGRPRRTSRPLPRGRYRQRPGARTDGDGGGRFANAEALADAVWALWNHDLNEEGGTPLVVATRIGDEPAPLKWLHSMSRRSQVTFPVALSIAAVPGEPNVT